MKQVSVVYKYGTGQEVPPDAHYLSTVVEEVVCEDGSKLRLVWHYFRVEKYV